MHHLRDEQRSYATQTGKFLFNRVRERQGGWDVETGVEGEVVECLSQPRSAKLSHLNVKESEMDSFFFPLLLYERQQPI
ncbi:hypothetical protein E2C01_054123 [Portunus trituberculatus]|uniref:Uncharacterized protein n=1 Tax=Portunus trituberculatus TaxID=210409 RepID=A0A5B7GR36_PORTR|nr:hypothetical protein [Portunus trituberculatus]